MLTLTRRHRQTLTTYLKWRNQPPTAIGFWLSIPSLLRVALLLLSSFGAVLYLSRMGMTQLAWFIAGLLIGILVAEFAMMRLMIGFWPVFERVLNWTEIERILHEGVVDDSDGNPFIPSPRPHSENPYQSPGAS